MSRYCEHRPNKRVGLLLLACMVTVGLGCAHNASAVVRMSAGIDSYAGDFDFLSQYGEWMGVPPYGLVWSPYVDESWAPFYDGRWIWTNDGWAWDSYEPFGELVYHYGYWYYDRDIGWFWMPGDEWSAARVQWYTDGAYCGWAPLPPPNFYWPNPWDYCDYDVWIVVHVDNFCDDHIGHRAIDRPRYREVLRRDGVGAQAPDMRQVKTLTRREIPVNTITKRATDIRANQIKVAERSTTQRTVAEARATSRPQQRTIAPKQNIQTPREVAVPRQKSETQREVSVPRQPAQAERKVDTPARSAQSAPSRTEERSSDRPIKKPANR